MASKKAKIEYSDKLADKICEQIAAGSSLRSIAKTIGVSERTIGRWMRDRPDFQSDYENARDARGDYYGTKVSDVAQKCEDGGIDPNAARVAMDGYKWTAARMAPKRWGDRQNVDVTSDGKALRFFKVVIPGSGEEES